MCLTCVTLRILAASFANESHKLAYLLGIVKCSNFRSDGWMTLYPMSRHHEERAFKRALPKAAERAQPLPQANNTVRFARALSVPLSFKGRREAEQRHATD